MRYLGKSMWALALVATLVLAGWLSAPAAMAATQAELEAKVMKMEQELQMFKAQLSDMKAVQKQAVMDKKASSKQPSWMDRITPYGDIRLRYEHTHYSDTTIKGVTKSKNGKDRFRSRVRLGVKAKVTDDLEAGLRMATGSDADPTSTNQTNGNFFAEFAKWGLDRAYVKWTPSAVPQKFLTVIAGKAANPFMTSKLMWDGDVVPEGLFLQGTFNKSGSLQPYALVGYMFVEQGGEWSDNAYAPSAQLGLHGKVGNFKLKLATSYYDWGKFGREGNVPDEDMYHGNIPYADAAGVDRLSNFQVWDVYAKAKVSLSKKASVGVWGHYLKNLDATGPNSGKDQGWAAGAEFNYDRFGVFGWYKMVEANATPGFISDSDSGFVNTKGWIAGLKYKLSDRATAQVTYFNIEPEDADIGGSNKFQTVLVDMVFKF